MKKSTTSARRDRRQRGFSILEILIATVLISSLIASGLYYANIGDKAVAADVTAVKAAIAVRFPEAIMTVYAIKQTLAGTTLNDLVGTGSVQQGQPVAWTVASNPKPTADSLSIALTFDNAGIAAAMQTYLNNNSDTMLVSGATVGGTGNTVLTVAYDLN